MLGILRATVGVVIVVIAADMRTAAAFAPRLVGRSRLSSSITSTLATTQRWMQNEAEAATQERSEEEKAAIKAAREARK